MVSFFQYNGFVEMVEFYHLYQELTLVRKSLKTKKHQTVISFLYETIQQCSLKIETRILRSNHDQFVILAITFYNLHKYTVLIIVICTLVIDI